MSSLRVYNDYFFDIFWNLLSGAMKKIFNWHYDLSSLDDDDDDPPTLTAGQLADPAFVFHAILFSGVFIPDSYRYNYDFILAMILVDPYFYRTLSLDERGNKNLAIMAVTGEGIMLQHVGDLNDYRDVVISAVFSIGIALKYASAKLRADPEVVLCAVRNEGTALRYASDELKADKQIVISAVNNRGIALQYASDELRDNYYIATIALRESAYAYRFVSDKLRDNLDIWNIASSVPTNISELSYRLRCNLDIMAPLVSKHGKWILRHIPENLHSKLMALVNKVDNYDSD
jgi:hypothetical protein